jgi:dTDP-4-amino-4,6-dideoxygalactose transaminase
LICVNGSCEILHDDGNEKSTVKLENRNDGYPEIFNFSADCVLIVLASDYYEEFKNYFHVWHLFTIRTKNRQKLQDFLAKEKIQTVIHYPIPPHKQKAYKEFNHLSFPITEKIHEEILSLPLYPHLEKNNIDKIVEAVNIFKE